jgi:KamA family protein
MSIAPPRHHGAPAGDGDTAPLRYRAVTAASVQRHPVWERLDADQRRALVVVSQVLPFKANEYVIDQLVDWSRVPEDPIYQLVFPQKDMLEPEAFAAVARAMDSGDTVRLDAVVAAVRETLNPHPAGQMEANVPMLDGRPLPGVQHKYPETVLYFPAAGQTCHAYCTFCFRWPQFVGTEEQRFRSNEHADLHRYLREHPEVSDLLVTGGDPMVMATRHLERIVEPILSDPALEHIRSIRFGTKSVAYWPQRFVSDADSDDLLRLMERIVASDRHVAIMGHYSHPRELGTPVAQQAVRRIRSTGANVRMQSPVIRHVNDSAEVWRDLWTAGVRLGCIPYYMFVERDTGARRYFEMPLTECLRIFREAYSAVSGLCRTVRGPSMSAYPGKVHILGETRVGTRKAFMLEYLQCRRPELVRRPFFAAFDRAATWFDQLLPLGTDDARYFPASWPRPKPLWQVRIA